MPSSLDFMKPTPLSIGSADSTPAVPPPTSPSQPPQVADSSTADKASMNLPFSPSSSVSPVFDNAAGRQKAADIKAKSLKMAQSTPPPPPPTPAPTPAPNVPPGFVDPNAPGMADYNAKNAAISEAQKTPGTIQQGNAGFQATTNAPATQADITKYGLDPSMIGKNIDRTALENWAAQSKNKNEAMANIQAANDAATAAGVTASFDPSSGMWIDNATGKPQIPPSTEPITSGKYGQQQGDIILSGQYFGLSTGQADAIVQAGEDVRKKLDPAIQAQQEQSQKDEQSALIRGGQGGGFLSTQIAGKAADMSVGGSWAGAGGTLKQLQDDYDQSLARMKDEEAKAIQTATSYALTAARTGRAVDFDAANSAQSRITEIQSSNATLAQQKLDALKSVDSLKVLERSDATDTISNLAANGYTADNLPKQYLADLDKHLQAGGMPPGSASMMLATAGKVQAAKNLTEADSRQKAEIDNAKNIVGILKDVPAGKSIAIGDTTYTGMSHGDLKTGTETDQSGKVTAWSFDPVSGKTTTTDMGYIGKPADGWSTVQTDQGFFSYNSKTGQSVPLQPTQAQATWQKMFPNGSQSPFRGKDDPMQGQCAAFCNDLYGNKILGDSFEQKQKALDPYKVDSKDVQVGDTFLMSAGTTGHVGIVAGVTKGPDGKAIITALESNYHPPGGGVISSTRTMSVDDPKLKMFARVPTPNLPPAGPDSPFTRAAMGNEPTINGVPLSRAIGGGVNDSQQKVIDHTLALVSKGTISADTAMKRIAQNPFMHGVDPASYSDDIKDAETQGNLTTAQKEEQLARTKTLLTATEARTVNSVLSPLGFRTDPSVVGYKNARANINRVYAADNQYQKLSPDYTVGNAVLDSDLLDGYIRMATGNAVTETQVSAIKNNQSKWNEALNIIPNAAYGGFLTPESRKQIMDLSAQLLDETKKSSDESIKTYYQPALDQYGSKFQLNPDMLLSAQDTSSAASTKTPMSKDEISQFQGELNAGEKLYTDGDGNPVAADPSVDDVSDLTLVQ